MNRCSWFTIAKHSQTTIIQRIFFHIAFSLHEKLFENTLRVRKHVKRVNAHITIYNEMLALYELRALSSSLFQGECGEGSGEGVSLGRGRGHPSPGMGSGVSPAGKV